jgi:hypothetical protein
MGEGKMGGWVGGWKEGRKGRREKVKENKVPALVRFLPSFHHIHLCLP